MGSLLQYMLLSLRHGPPYYEGWLDAFKAWAPSLCTISWHLSLKLQYKNGWLCYHFPHGQLRGGGGPRLGTISLGCTVTHSSLLHWKLMISRGGHPFYIGSWCFQEVGYQFQADFYKRWAPFYLLSDCYYERLVPLLYNCRMMISRGGHPLNIGSRPRAHLYIKCEMIFLQP